MLKKHHKSTNEESKEIPATLQPMAPNLEAELSLFATSLSLSFPLFFNTSVSVCLSAYVCRINILLYVHKHASAKSLEVAER
ncbi:hypothetical protein RND71_025032 [Anisodus tanguticus]|uniref:Uncharacterized protein n=1 Tax=Anisodus tanguticus TaxID=243964 RepID=A0AAE1RS62_9SOLA|nr:hypothetical protein RND71_025032 [Anisodus tanguticus]